MLVPIHWPCIKLVASFVLKYHNRLFSRDVQPSSTAQTAEATPGNTTVLMVAAAFTFKYVYIYSMYGVVCCLVNRNRAGSRAPSAPIPVGTDGPKAAVTGSSDMPPPASPLPPPATAPGRNMSSYQIFPWLLPSADHRALVNEVETLLVEEGVLSIVTGTNINKMSDINPVDADLAGQYTIIASMASSYVRLWLSLREIQYKDSHPRVVKAMTTVVNYVHAQVLTVFFYLLPFSRS